MIVYTKPIVQTIALPTLKEIIAYLYPFIIR